MTIEELTDLKKEVQIMLALDHPNIVRYYETYDDRKNIYLCMELCEGGEILKCQ
jgi:calcium-dependent protein kinase